MNNAQTMSVNKCGQKTFPLLTNTLQSHVEYKNEPVSNYFDPLTKPYPETARGRS